MFDMIHDTVIIGGGPAGLTAGLYAARAKMSVILVEKNVPGGQCMVYEQVENYPGFPEGIEAPELVQRMKSQAIKYGLRIMKEEVLSLDCDGNIKILAIKSGAIKTKSIIIATGAQPRKLGVSGEEELIGGGVSYCATCDGAFFEDCVISVVGGGDVAVEEAIYLTRFGSVVYIIHRKDQLRATKIIQERARQNNKIQFIMNTIVQSIEGEGNVNHLRLKSLKTCDEYTHATDAAFIFVGTVPNTNFIKDKIKLDSNGYIVVNAKMETNIKGIYAAGDVIGKECRQIATAVGDGALAAFNAIKYVEPY